MITAITTVSGTTGIYLVEALNDNCKGDATNKVEIAVSRVNWVCRIAVDWFCRFTLSGWRRSPPLGLRVSGQGSTRRVSQARYRPSPQITIWEPSESVCTA